MVLCPSLYSAFVLDVKISPLPEVPLEDSILATYRALHLLSTRTALRGKPISLVGEGRGGSVAELCARSFTQHSLSPSLGFSKIVIIDAFPLILEPTPYTTSSIVVVHGEYDSLAPLAHIQKLKGFMPAATRLVTLRCNHEVLSQQTIQRHRMNVFTQCAVEERDEGFVPLYYPSPKMLDESSLCSLTRLLPWGYLQQVMEKSKAYISSQVLPWRDYVHFFRSHEITVAIVVGHSHPSIRAQALREIECRPPCYMTL
jgi:hypothetical protein